jgi:hypothetical protein
LKNIHLAKIYHQLVQVYGEGVKNMGNACNLCLFNAGAHNAVRYGCPSVIAEDLNKSADVHVHENGRITIDELHEVFPHVSQSVPYETVTVWGCKCTATDKVKETELFEWTGDGLP